MQIFISSFHSCYFFNSNNVLFVGMFYIKNTYYLLGPFPEMDTSAQGPLEKLNHIHNGYKTMLENTLAGYCLPDPYNVPKLREVI